MSSVCSICCDENATSLSKMCSNKKCKGNICHNCVSEIITFKGKTHKNQVLSYQCPYCKSDSNNLKKHFTKLKDNEITSLITKKTTVILDKQENIKYNLKCEIWDLRDEIKKISDICSRLRIHNFNLKVTNKELEDSEANKRIKELEKIIIQNKLDNHKLKKENSRLENINKSNQLTINKYESWIDNTTKLYNEKKEEISNLNSIISDLDNILNPKEISLDDNISLEEEDIQEPVINLTPSFNSVSEKKKFHCVCCNKTMNDNSKYNHFKTKIHLRNQQRLLNSSEIDRVPN